MEVEKSMETSAIRTETYTEVKSSSSVTVKKSSSLHRKKSKKDEKNISVVSEFIGKHSIHIIKIYIADIAEIKL